MRRLNYFGNNFSSGLKIGGFVLASLGASNSINAEEKKERVRETTLSIKKSTVGIEEESAKDPQVQESNQIKNR